MKIAIVEDLQSDASILEHMINDWLKKHFCTMDILIFSDGKSFLNEYNPDEFAVIFLDIVLDDKNADGIEIARRIRQISPSQCLVFTTRETSYALDAFSVHAFDYLVKPFTAKHLDYVMQEVCREKLPPAVIEVHKNREVTRIPVDSILYITSVNRMTELHTNLGVFSTYTSLNEIFDKLAPYPHFQNCCRGMLVNLDQVKDMEHSDFILHNGEHIPISRPKRAEMRACYTQYLFRRLREGD